MVTEVDFDEEGVITSCIIEAVLTKRSILIQWQDLKNIAVWQQGWK